MRKSIIYILPLMLFLAFFQSCDEIIFEEDISNLKVTLIAPVNNAEFFSTGVTFTWERIEDVPLYQLQIATPNFSAPLQVVLDTITAGSSFTKQLPVGNYEWRVRAMNSSYKTQYSSRLMKIVSNDDFQSNTVVLLSPSNSLITNSVTHNLSWQAIIGAIDYQVQISDSNNTVISDQTVTNTSLSFTFPEGNHQWRVRANNGIQQTLYASRNLLVDTTSPNTPTLTNPTHLSTTENTNISFQWNRLPILGSIEKDSIYIYTDSALTSLHLKDEASSPFSINLDSGTYYWFLKAFDQAGNIGNQSSVFSFTIE